MCFEWIHKSLQGGTVISDGTYLTFSSKLGKRNDTAIITTGSNDFPYLNFKAAAAANRFKYKRDVRR